MGRPKKKISNDEILQNIAQTTANPFAFKEQLDEAALFTTPEVPQAPPSDPLEELLTSPYEQGSYDEKVFLLASKCNASIEEISEILSLPTQTLKDEFQGAMDKGWTACRIRLRRSQLAAGNAGDSKMMSHLGKNILKQDKDDEEQKGNVTIMISTGVPRRPEDVVTTTVVKPSIEKTS